MSSENVNKQSVFTFSSLDLLNPDMKYIPIKNKNLVQYIKEQISAKDTVKQKEKTVKLVFKDNKIYCNTNLLQS